MRSSSLCSAVFFSTVTALTLTGCSSENQVKMNLSKGLVMTGEMVHEECFDLEKDQSIKFRFESNASLMFNVHYHEGEEVTYPIEEIALQKLDDKFVAPLNQHYCLMWQNPTMDEVNLAYQID